MVLLVIIFASHAKVPSSNVSGSQNPIFGFWIGIVWFEFVVRDYSGIRIHLSKCVHSTLDRLSWIRNSNMLLLLRKGAPSYFSIRAVQNRSYGFNYLFLLYQYNLLKRIRCNWSRLIDFEQFRLKNRRVRKGADLNAWTEKRD